MREEVYSFIQRKYAAKEVIDAQRVEERNISLLNFYILV